MREQGCMVTLWRRLKDLICLTTHFYPNRPWSILWDITVVFRQPEPVIYCRDAKLLTSLAPIPKRCPSSWFLIDFTLTGQNSYLGNMTSAAQGKSSKGGSPSQAALAGLRLPAELHVVSGATQRATGTTSGSTPQPKVRDYRQQASNQSSPYLNPSSYGVPNNQIYQVGFFLQIDMLCNFYFMINWYVYFLFLGDCQVFSTVARTWIFDVGLTVKCVQEPVGRC